MSQEELRQELISQSKTICSLAADLEHSEYQIKRLETYIWQVRGLLWRAYECQLPESLREEIRLHLEENSDE